jgi:hypothetical protein
MEGEGGGALTGTYAHALCTHMYTHVHTHAHVKHAYKHTNTHAHLRRKDT